MLGALVAVLEREASERGEMPIAELAAALYALADVIEVESLEAWNDTFGRSCDDVVAALDRAAGTYSSTFARAS